MDAKWKSFGQLKEVLLFEYIYRYFFVTIPVKKKKLYVLMQYPTFTPECMS